MGNFAVLDNNNQVVNIIVTDNKEQSEQDLNAVLVESTEENVAAIGFIWNGSSFMPVPIPPIDLPEIVEETPTE
jgi:hypothetical protein